jgi:hypothetical protein
VTYDDRLAGGIRRALAGRRDVVEREMMGGLCFTLRGHMCCGIATGLRPWPMVRKAIDGML